MAYESNMFLSYLKTLQSLRDKHLISLAQSQGPWDLFSVFFSCSPSWFLAVCVVAVTSFASLKMTCVCLCVCVLVPQSYLTLCNPIALAYFHLCTSDSATDSNLRALPSRIMFNSSDSVFKGFFLESHLTALCMLSNITLGTKS